jgi:hypothetical protein
LGGRKLAPSPAVAQASEAAPPSLFRVQHQVTVMFPAAEGVQKVEILVPFVHSLGPAPGTLAQNL